MLIKYITTTIVITCLTIINNPVRCGCREQETHECESICRVNGEGKFYCELRGALILPDLTTIEASLSRVRPVIHLATQKIRDDGILPDYVNITWHEFNDECDPAISTISAIDAYTKKCSHFIIGPSCEYSVASVSRLAKYFYNDGLNVITAGAFTFNFEEPKKTCKSEFHMLQRVGTVSFEKIANFTADLMKNYNWTQAKFIYDRDAYRQVGGKQTCNLLMNGIAKTFEKEKIIYSPFVVDLNSTVKLTESLKTAIGTDYSGE